MQPKANQPPSARLVDILQARLCARDETIAAQDEVISNLRDELDKLRRLLFSPRSERHVVEADPLQGALFDLPESEIPTPEPEEASKPKQRTRRPGRRRLRLADIPEGTPVREIVIEPDCDLTGLRRNGAAESWYLDQVPARFELVRTIRRKYVDPNNPDRGVIMGDLPRRLIDRGNAGPGLLAHIVTDKYVNHLPLYRQAAGFKRQGVNLPRSTLGDWTAKAAASLEPLYAALKAEAIDRNGYLQVDETTVKVQDRTRQGSTHKGYMWTYLAAKLGLMVMEYQKTRARAGPVKMLAPFAGALQSDGYVAYETFDARESVETYGCMAHARRYFFECKSTNPKESAYVMGQLRKLYMIERRLRERRADAKTRRAVRRKEARPILGALKTWLTAHAGLPKSKWGKAVRYSLNRWAKLTRYVDNGEVEIDNNLVENALRPLALGRKNYLFAGSHDAAQRSAVLYSLLGACKLHGVNPLAWLTDVLRRLPTHPVKDMHELLPHHWKSAVRPALRKAA